MALVEEVCHWLGGGMDFEVSKDQISTILLSAPATYGLFVSSQLLLQHPPACHHASCNGNKTSETVSKPLMKRFLLQELP